MNRKIDSPVNGAFIFSWKSSGWSPLSYSETFLSWWKWPFSGQTPPPSPGHEAEWFDEHRNEANHTLTRTGLNIYGRCWREALDGVQLHLYLTIGKMTIFWRNGGHSASTVRVKCTKAVLATYNTLHLVFPFIRGLFCCMWVKMWAAVTFGSLCELLAKKLHI